MHRLTSMQKKVRTACSDMHLKPVKIAFNDLDSDQLPELIAQRGVVIVSSTARDCIQNLIPSECTRLPQYEMVFAGQKDPTVMIAVPQKSGNPLTKAFAVVNTPPHVDGYSYAATGRYKGIAGIGNMADEAILAYTHVSDPRRLSLSDLKSAFDSLTDEDKEILSQPLYRLNIAEYKEKDPDLPDPGLVSVHYLDGRDGESSFLYGSRLRSEDPDAQCALDLFRLRAARFSFDYLVNTGDAFVINQRTVAHGGFRKMTPEGQTPTELVRFLLRRQF